jgi:asparagine synthetase B (glutamine-hydrolysing)
MTAADLLTILADAVEDATAYDRDGNFAGDNVGISLSGGLDSSTVACLAGGLLPAFTGYYDGAVYDERTWSRIVPATVHHEIRITPLDFVLNFDAMVAASTPPWQGPGALGQYVVAKFASDYVNVLVSGEGSDELFGGYARQMIVAGEAPPDGYEDYRLPDGYPTDLEAALAWDYERLPDLLAVDNAMTGAFDIEARAPFTDQRVVEFALALPARDRVGKRYLREAVRGVVPEQIINRTDKRGFPAPFVAWANDDADVREFVLERIGYLPDRNRPWAREWWTELCERTYEAVAA